MNSEYDDYETDEDPTEAERNLPNPARVKMRQLEKENKELKKAMEEHAAKLADRTVGDVLAKVGIADPRASAWLKKDVENLSDTAAVDKWIADNGSLFGAKATEETPQDPPEADAYRQITQTSAQGIPTGDREAEMQAEMGKFENAEELTAFLKRQGV